MNEDESSIRRYPVFSLSSGLSIFRRTVIVDQSIAIRSRRASYHCRKGTLGSRCLWFRPRRTVSLRWFLFLRPFPPVGKREHPSFFIGRALGRQNLADAQCKKPAVRFPCLLEPMIDQSTRGQASNPAVQAVVSSPMSTASRALVTPQLLLRGWRQFFLAA
ncbi:hypothetical protein VTN77DRAFT_8133 [Rasamsonia byssochlamydoides]|uniref:uncharacterized protein n=1 Tax=Rasamsonia byssochlamydoides TaxID=89139 RepID=UPI00374340F6